MNLINQLYSSCVISNELRGVRGHEESETAAAYVAKDKLFTLMTHIVNLIAQGPTSLHHIIATQTPTHHTEHMYWIILQSPRLHLLFQH